MTSKLCLLCHICVTLHILTASVPTRRPAVSTLYCCFFLSKSSDVSLLLCLAMFQVTCVGCPWPGTPGTRGLCTSLPSFNHSNTFLTFIHIESVNQLFAGWPYTFSSSIFSSICHLIYSDRLRSPNACCLYRLVHALLWFLSLSLFLLLFSVLSCYVPGSRCWLSSTRYPKYKRSRYQVHICVVAFIQP